jgi:predicted unusual protein kinase regulating ubiquinone biosynthesis (AarF/ABC1/UbiB family)
MIDQNEESYAARSTIRTTQFWLRASSIYFSYKIAQLQAVGLRALGWTPDRLKQDHWANQHAKAGASMYNLCVDMRGFYLKAGQFLGARGDFVPEQICRRLSLLHDQVPPMPPPQAGQCIQEELGSNNPLDKIFEWIDLEHPLGSASISQVHKAKLSCYKGKPSHGVGGRRSVKEEAGEAACPLTTTTTNYNNYNIDITLRHEILPVDMDAVCASAPTDGVVAVKIQYPNALPTMSLDLKNIRLLADFLSKTEIKFDMVSAVDELAAQIRLEFDFQREARVMNAVHKSFAPIQSRIVVPSSVTGLVTDRLLVMTFLDGVPITKMRDAKEYQNLSAATKRLAARRILSRVSEAYGRMVLLDGLFQADGHPGNIMVLKGGRIGLIDYGQSKRLPDSYRAAFAGLVVALAKGDRRGTSAALDGLGVVVSKDDDEIKSRLATGMFDTRGKADPFDPDSPIKKAGIVTFPRDMFFVLRVVQLLRGLANGMGVEDFSAAKQWQGFAEEARKKLKDVVLPGDELSNHISEV